MTNPKMYDSLKTILTYLEGDNIKEAIPLCKNVMKELSAEMARNNAKQNGGKEALVSMKAYQRILKEAMKQEGRPILQGVSQDVITSEWVLCDSYRMVIFNKKPDIPVSPVNDVEGKRIAFTRCMPEGVGVPLTLPSVGEVKTFIQIHKGEKKVAYKLTDADGTDIYFNPQFLLDMMEAIPNATVRAYGRLRAIVMENDELKGILLPVNPPKDE